MKRAELVAWLDNYADAAERMGLHDSAAHHREAARLIEEDGAALETRDRAIAVLEGLIDSMKATAALSVSPTGGDANGK